jgi:hypothetical protein
MVIYNVTVKVDLTVCDEWLEWMKKIHIPEVMNTLLFTEARFTKVLGEDEVDGKTYSIQYLCKDLETFNKYQDNYAKSLQQKTQDLYNGKYFAFRTLLEVVDIFEYKLMEEIHKN